MQRYNLNETHSKSDVKYNGMTQYCLIQGLLFHANITPEI